MRTILIFIFSLITLIGSARPLIKDTLLQKIEALSSPLERAKAYNQAAQNAWESGAYSSAVHYAMRGLELCTSEASTTVKAQLLNNHGIANDYLGNYTSALNSYFKALRLAEKAKAPNIEADICGNIGIIYANQYRPEKASIYHSRALKIRRKIKDEHGISASLNNIAIIYVQEKRFEEAIKNYKECIQIDEKLGDTRGLGDDYNNIGLCYLDMAEYPKAFEYLNKALAIRASMDNPLGVAETTNNIGTAYFNQKEYAKAKPYFLNSIPYAQKIGNKESLKYAYQMLYKTEERGSKDSVSAYHFYKLYILYKDSIDNSENARLQTAYELKYKFDKEKELTKIQQAQKDYRSKLIISTISAGFVLILIFSTLLFKRWKETQHQRRIIEEKNVLVEQKNSEITDSINYAKRIQTAILPSEAEIAKIIPDHFVIYLPKDIVSGDFYWIEEQNDYRFIGVADCTGHGVPGALMSVVCHNALNRCVREFGLTSPSDILDKTRTLIIEEISKVDQHISDGMDISLCVHKKGTTRIQWAGANNPLLIFRAADAELIEIRPDKQSIGFNRQQEPFRLHHLSFAPEDKLYLFSDGFADQFGGERGKKYMSKNFRQLIMNTSHLPFHAQKQELERAFYEWKGSLEQVDDICVICFSIA